AAKVLVLLQHDEVNACFGQLERHAKPGQPSADDHHTLALAEDFLGMSTSRDMKPISSESNSPSSAGTSSASAHASICATCSGDGMTGSRRPSRWSITASSVAALTS